MSTSTVIVPPFHPMLTRLRPSMLALLGLLAVNTTRAQTAVPHAPSVSVVTATEGSIAENVVVTGTLVPREEVLVSPQLDALAITEVLAEEGDRVAANQVLARLSREVLDASVAQNAAQVARAEAAVAQARSTITENQANRVQVDLALARTRELLANGNASRESLRAAAGERRDDGGPHGGEPERVARGRSGFGAGARAGG